MKIFLAFIAVIFGVQDGQGQERRVCYYTSRTVDEVRVQQMIAVDDESKEQEYGPGKITGDFEECPRSSDHCYAFWREDTSQNKTGGIIYIAQGCWESSGRLDCEAAECISNRRPPKALNNTNFCCCTGNYCNTNATYVYSQDEDDPHLEQAAMPPVERLNVAVVTVVVAMGIFTLALVLFGVRMYYSRRRAFGKPSHEAVHLIEHSTVFASSFNLDDLKLEAIIGQGRYGQVWRGSIGQVDIAVKVVQQHNRIYFCNERDNYCLPFMNHPSLLSYFGCDERTGPEGGSELILLLSLCPLGSLQNYLRGNTIDWPTFCRMSLSIAAGLAHLHTEIRKGDKWKPCISHRDLNSNNILIREDFSCAICDFGFATQIKGSSYYFNGEEQHAEVKSITDVGTLRYISPEVLEGAVNLRDCETSLKQIDVYALGLVLWEIATRCTDFYPNGVECGPYRLPFEAEIGHPTLEQMQVLVCRHKARPLFPDLWRETAAVRTVRETIEDCWDHDADARLTALCVEERFHELSGFTERQKGIVYTTGISPIGRSSGIIHRESHNVFDLDAKDDMLKESGGDSCQSEATGETILTITPTIPQMNCKNSNQLYGFCPSLQPYQGRNPCLERNLMAARDGESSSSELVDKSHKHVTETLSSVPVIAPPLPPSNFNSPPAPAVPPQSRTTLPIPFLQNVSSEPAQPKLSNLLAGVPRRSTWTRIRAVFTGSSNSEALLSNETAINVSTPMEDKLLTKVEISNGRIETHLAGVQRPDSLPISPLRTPDCSRHKTESNVDPFDCHPQLKDPSRRVKTPGDMPSAVRKARGQKNFARFSLYDDRMMSGCFDNDRLYCTDGKTGDDHRSSCDDVKFSQDATF